MQITTIGLDIAKNVFQVHGIDAAEKVVVRKQLRRGQVMKFFAALPPCLVGMEACAAAQQSLAVPSVRSFPSKGREAPGSAAVQIHHAAWRYGSVALTDEVSHPGIGRVASERRSEDQLQRREVDDAAHGDRL